VGWMMNWLWRTWNGDSEGIVGKACGPGDDCGAVLRMIIVGWEMRDFVF